MEVPDWAQVVAAATRAPSIHDSQPWQFVAAPDRLDVFLDRDRALPVLDPTARQQVISCGSAVEFAVVALSAAGYDGEVYLLTDDGDPDHLATITLTGRREPTEEDRTLAETIGHRHPVGAALQPRAVPTGLADRLQEEGHPYGTWVTPVPEPAELAAWLRGESSGGDVVPDGPDAPPGEGTRPIVVLLGADGDDRYAWLQSGRALGRLLLVATAEGLAASPLTQVLDRPAVRARIQARLSLAGPPQMLVRIGRPPEASGAESKPRPVGEVLRLVPAAG